jgi:hypothetical protein
VLVLNEDPNLVEPVTKSTLDVIVCTTKVCAVNVPATVKLFANDAVTAETAFDADCAKATNDAVEANDADSAFATNDAVEANDAEVIEPEIVMLPEVVILPLTFILPSTVSEPVTIGKY